MGENRSRRKWITKVNKPDADSYTEAISKVIRKMIVFNIFYFSLAASVNLSFSEANRLISDMFFSTEQKTE
jgi:hypothetical protein